MPPPRSHASPNATRTARSSSSPGREAPDRMATPSRFANILSGDDWLAILRCVGAEQERIDEERKTLAPEHPHHAAAEKAHADLAALRAKLHRLIEELGHAVT